MKKKLRILLWVGIKNAFDDTNGIISRYKLKETHHKEKGQQVQTMIYQHYTENDRSSKNNDLPTLHRKR